MPVGQWGCVSNDLVQWHGDFYAVVSKDCQQAPSVQLGDLACPLGVQGAYALAEFQGDAQGVRQ
jgi:hypothetical protein